MEAGEGARAIRRAGLLALLALAAAGPARAQPGTYETFDDLVAVPPLVEVDPLVGVCPSPCATWSFVGSAGDAAYRIQADASSIGHGGYGPSRAVSYLAGESLADFYVTADYLDWSGAAGPAVSVHGVGAGREIGLGTTDGYVLAHEVPTGAGTERIALARIDDEAYTVLAFQTVTLNPARDYRLALWRSGDDLEGLVRELPGGATVATLSATDASGWTDLAPGLLVAGTGYSDRPDAVFDEFYGGALPEMGAVTTSQIDGNPGDQFDAAIGGGYVSYTTNIGGSHDVRLLQLNGLPVVVYGGAGTQESSDVEGPMVVYTDNASGPANVHLFHAIEGTTISLVPSQITQVDPAVAGGGAVFASVTGSGGSLTYFDFATELPTTINSVGTEPRDPSIDGSLVAWSAFDGSSTNIYATVLGGSSSIVAADGDAGTPTVSGSRISYLTMGDIGLYDHSTGQASAVTNDPFPQLHAVVTGDLVYFNDDRFGNLEIFAHNVVSGQTWRLTDTPWDEFLTDAEGFQAVYHLDGFGGDFDVFRLTALPEPATSSGLLAGAALLAVLSVLRRTRRARMARCNVAGPASVPGDCGVDDVAQIRRAAIGYVCEGYRGS